jgi:hypothetical protein
MFFPCIRVTPDPKYSAEVVVLCTSLGAKRTEFNAGKRARDLLEIKRVHHKVVDFNRDARQAGTGEAENKAIHKLWGENKLQKGENDDLILPQIFIDGNYIGDAYELQGLEDDEFLEGILLRKTCMVCKFNARNPSSTECECCKEKFCEILPGMMTIEQALQAMEAQQAIEGMDYEDEYDEECDEEGAVDSVAALPQGLSPDRGSMSTLKETVRSPDVSSSAMAKPATVEGAASAAPSRQSQSLPSGAPPQGDRERKREETIDDWLEKALQAQDVGPLQSSDFDSASKRFLTELQRRDRANGTNGSLEAMKMIFKHARSKKREDVTKWSAYILTLLQDFDPALSEDLGWKRLAFEPKPRSGDAQQVGGSAPSVPSQPSLPPQREVASATSVQAAPVGKTAWKVGDKVQYWSDTKKRWIDAVVEGRKEKDGDFVYDLHCKKGASGEKMRARPES